MHGLKHIATSQIDCCNSDIVDKVEKRGSVTEREKKKRAAACMLQPKTAAYSSWLYLHLRAHNSFAENLLSAEPTVRCRSPSNHQERWGPWPTKA